MKTFQLTRISCQEFGDTEPKLTVIDFTNLHDAFTRAQNLYEYACQETLPPIDWKLVGGSYETEELLTIAGFVKFTIVPTYEED